MRVSWLQNGRLLEKSLRNGAGGPSGLGGGSKRNLLMMLVINRDDETGTRTKDTLDRLNAFQCDPLDEYRTVEAIACDSPEESTTLREILRTYCELPVYKVDKKLLFLSDDDEIKILFMDVIDVCRIKRVIAKRSCEVNENILNQVETRLRRSREKRSSCGSASLSNDRNR